MHNLEISAIAIFSAQYKISKAENAGALIFRRYRISDDSE